MTQKKTAAVAAPTAMLAMAPGLSEEPSLLEPLLFEPLLPEQTTTTVPPVASTVKVMVHELVQDCFQVVRASSFFRWALRRRACASADGARVICALANAARAGVGALGAGAILSRKYTGTLCVSY